jgi:hypothetical protein
MKGTFDRTERELWLADATPARFSSLLNTLHVTETCLYALPPRNSSLQFLLPQMQIIEGVWESLLDFVVYGP